jgi:hypothetical protein
MAARTLNRVIAIATVAGLAPAAAFAQTSSSTTGAGTEDLMAGDEWDAFDDMESDAGAADSGSDDPFGGAFGSETRVDIHGFLEAAAATRVVDDDRSADDFLLGESRGRLEVGVERPKAKGRLKVDFIGDALLERVDIDLREAWADFTLGTAFSLRAGRQVLTWGTGDFVFLNDLFPKDFQAFFIGRDDEFLKAPSDSLKLSFFLEGVGLDVVYNPLFAPDRFITGERLSFFFFPGGDRAGPSSDATPLDAQTPQADVENGEWHTRLYGTVAGWELAAYGYVGFFKQPLAFDPMDGTLLYPRLSVYGGSVRGLVFGGVFNVEGAFYHSWDDEDGTDPFVPNSQARALVGYELEVLPKLTIGTQYYLEAILNHGDQIENSPLPQFEPEELRHVVTLRVTYMALSDNLTLSLFGFVSPSEEDAYIRPKVSYKITEAVQATLGGNILLGQDIFTFFGQLENNTNVYSRLRFTF